MPLQTWRPDTCDCRVEVRHLEPPDPEVWTFSRLLVKCAVHAALTDQQVWTAIHGGGLVAAENIRKNFVGKTLLEDLALGMSETDPTTGTIVWKPNHGVTWAYTGSGATRVLTITPFGSAVQNVSTPKKNAITNYLNTTFGVGKVVVNWP